MTIGVYSCNQIVHCGKLFAKSGINRHLRTHFEKDFEKDSKGKSYLAKVEQNPSYGATPYFISLWVDGSALMKTLDKFLRDIWLESCGHMSAFRDPSIRSTRCDLGFF